MALLDPPLKVMTLRPRLIRKCVYLLNLKTASAQNLSKKCVSPAEANCITDSNKTFRGRSRGSFIDSDSDSWLAATTPGDSDSDSDSGVEAFVFHWGCTRLGALGNDRRGPIGCAHVGTESLLPLLDIFFFRQFPSRLVPRNEAFCTARNEKPQAYR